MDMKSAIHEERLSRLAQALGPGEPFGRYRLWSIPMVTGASIKLWARPGLGDDICRAWVFYPGPGDDRDAEEFRIQNPDQVEDLLRRLGVIGPRRPVRGNPRESGPTPGR